MHSNVANPGQLLKAQSGLTATLFAMLLVATAATMADADPAAIEAGQAFAFGAARNLYAENIRPRVMLGPAELASLKQQVREEPARRIFEALQARMQPLAQRVLEAEDLTRMIGEWNRNWTQPGTPIVQGLFDMALTGVLAGDRDLIEAVRQVLRVLPEAEQYFSLQRRPAYNLPHSLPWAYDLLWHELTPDERRAFTDWAVEACIRAPMRHPENYYRSAGGNVTLHAMKMPLAAILSIQGDDGVPDLEPELSESLQRLEASLHVAIGPDGYPEEDTGYGTMQAGILVQLSDMVRRAGLYDAYERCPRFARIGRAILHLVQPWGGFLSNTGDHSDGFQGRSFALARLAAETGDASLLWLLGTLTHPLASHRAHEKNRDALMEVAFSETLPNVSAEAMTLLALNDLSAMPPAHPADLDLPTAFRDRRRGIVSFRSGWEPDSTFVLFDGSQRSPGALGHAHDSCGHFSISALGEYFAIDTGRYNIEQSCHNVVLINGRSGRSTGGDWRRTDYFGRLIDYQPGDFVDTAAVDSSHQHDTIWAWRRLGLVKGAQPYVWTVDDINSGTNWSEYWWQLHTSPESEITLHEDHAVIRGWRHGNRLDVHFALPATNDYRRPHTLALSQDLATHSSTAYMTEPHSDARLWFDRPASQVHGAVFVRPRLLATVAGFQGRFMALMIPRRDGEEPARVERIASVPNSLAVRVVFADVEDILIYAYEHNLLEAGGVSARGEWCVLRRCRLTGKVLDVAIGNGTELK